VTPDRTLCACRSRATARCLAPCCPLSSRSSTSSTSGWARSAACTAGRRARTFCEECTTWTPCSALSAQQGSGSSRARLSASRSTMRRSRTALPQSTTQAPAPGGSPSDGAPGGRSCAGFRCHGRSNHLAARGLHEVVLAAWAGRVRRTPTQRRVSTSQTQLVSWRALLSQTRAPAALCAFHSAAAQPNGRPIVHSNTRHPGRPARTRCRHGDGLPACRQRLPRDTTLHYFPARRRSPCRSDCAAACLQAAEPELAWFRWAGWQTSGRLGSDRPGPA
jgi:hypothetical protein